MEFKGTKGPWIAVKNSSFYNVKTSLYATDLSIMVMLHDKNINPIHHSDENKANALLISKAPEMLEALQQLKESLDDGIETKPNSQFHGVISELIKSATQI